MELEAREQNPFAYYFTRVEGKFVARRRVFWTPNIEQNSRLPREKAFLSSCEHVVGAPGKAPFPCGPHGAPDEKEIIIGIGLLVA